MSALVLGVRLLLAVVFAIAGIAKLLDYDGSRKSLISFGLPVSLAKPFGRLLPLVELICAVALIPNRTTQWGALGIAVLLAVFIAGIMIVLAQGRTPDCHCFGQLHTSPVSMKTLQRNLILLALASFVLWKHRENTTADVWRVLSGLGTYPALMIGIATALTVAVALESWFLFNLLRQNGRLLLRIEVVEAKLKSDPAATPTVGLPVGTPAPDFVLKGLDGERVTLGRLRESRHPVLLAFSGPDCGACDALLPQLADWQTEHAERLRIAVITKGSVATNRTKSEKHGLRYVLLEGDSDVSEAYLVTGTPSAVLVVDGIIDSSVAVGGDEIRELIHRATLPPTVDRGGLVPSLRLPNLDGETVDLASLKGRRTMVLFWSPNCGFCGQMLDEVKKWEEERPSNSPELLIISSGTVAANRALGFRSLVLLDSDFGAGNVLGSAGTPSAVLVDEHGRIASDISVGAEEVMALAGATPRKTVLQ